ncbi:MAG: MerR family transcriptional regulator, partial [Gammaproteobacteria bacterium]|nr:MerR family transcriptional regulator [Gammaproteobacteria bacterium]
RQQLEGEGGKQDSHQSQQIIRQILIELEEVLDILRHH